LFPKKRKIKEEIITITAMLAPDSPFV